MSSGNSRALTRKTLVGLLASVGFALALVLSLRALDLDSLVFDWLVTIRDAGWRGRLGFVAVVTLAVVLIAPGVVLTLGAGLVYGPFGGSLLVVSGATLGATIAFLAGRYAFTDGVRRLLVGRGRTARVITRIEPGDWRLVALVRMIPFFPFKVSNYLFGVTPLRLPAYVAGTFIGLWPVTYFNAWLGSLAGDLLALQSGDAPTLLEGPWILKVAAVVFTAAVLLLVVRRTARLFAE